MGPALTADVAGRVLYHGGVRLRFRAQGVGPGVLLIHGWALDLDMWRPQFDELTANYRVIAFDRRGFGLSSGEPNLERDVDDVQAVLDELGLRETAIIGMSQGARVALRYALRSPSRVSHLILDGPPRETRPLDDAIEEIPIGDYRQLVRREGIDAFRLQWLRHPLTRLQTSDPHIRQLLDMIVRRYPGTDLAWSDTAPGTSFDSIEDELHGVTMPVLVINGDCDSQQRHATAAAIASLIPNSRHVIVAGAAHLPNMDNAPEYNRLVRQFLTLSPPPSLANTRRS
jgi:pimeloyl-ACP methyl ester carboxylesterase